MRLIKWISSVIEKFFSAYESRLVWYHDELIKAVDSKDYLQASLLWSELQRAMGNYDPHS